MPITLRDSLEPLTMRESARYSPGQANFADYMEAQDTNPISRGWVSTSEGLRGSELLAEANAAERAGDMLRAQQLELQAQDHMRRAQTWAPTTQNFTDINGLGAAANWVGGQAGSGARSMIAPLAGGVGGRVLGGLAGGLIAGPAGAAIGANLGGVGGAFLPSADMQYNESVGQSMMDPEIRSKRTAEEIHRTGQKVGAVGGALDAVVPAGIGKLAVGGIGKRTVGRIMAREAGEEAVTEGAQSYVGQTGQNQLAGRELTDYDHLDAFNAAMAGAVGGGVMGGAGAMVGAARDKLAAGGEKVADVARDPVQTVVDAVHRVVKGDPVKRADREIAEFEARQRPLSKMFEDERATANDERIFEAPKADEPDAQVSARMREDVDRWADRILTAKPHELGPREEELRSAAAQYKSDKDWMKLRGVLRKNKLADERSSMMSSFEPEGAKASEMTTEGQELDALSNAWLKNEGKRYGEYFADGSDEAKGLGAKLFAWIKSDFGKKLTEDGEIFIPRAFIEALGDRAPGVVESAITAARKEGWDIKDAGDAVATIREYVKSNEGDTSFLSSAIRYSQQENWTWKMIQRFAKELRQKAGRLDKDDYRWFKTQVGDIVGVLEHFQKPSRFYKAENKLKNPSTKDELEGDLGLEAAKGGDTDSGSDITENDADWNSGVNTFSAPKSTINVLGVYDIADPDQLTEMKAGDGEEMGVVDHARRTLSGPSLTRRLRELANEYNAPLAEINRRVRMKVDIKDEVQATGIGPEHVEKLRVSPDAFNSKTKKRDPIDGKDRGVLFVEVRDGDPFVTSSAKLINTVRQDKDTESSQYGVAEAEDRMLQGLAQLMAAMPEAGMIPTGRVGYKNNAGGSITWLREAGSKMRHGAGSSQAALIFGPSTKNQRPMAPLNLPDDFNFIEKSKADGYSRANARAQRQARFKESVDAETDLNVRDLNDMTVSELKTLWGDIADKGVGLLTAKQIATKKLEKKAENLTKAFNQAKKRADMGRISELNKQLTAAEAELQKAKEPLERAMDTLRDQLDTITDEIESRTQIISGRKYVTDDFGTQLLVGGKERVPGERKFAARDGLTRKAQKEEVEVGTAKEKVTGADGKTEWKDTGRKVFKEKVMEPGSPMLETEEFAQNAKEKEIKRDLETGYEITTEPTDVEGWWKGENGPWKDLPLPTTNLNAPDIVKARVHALLKKGAPAANFAIGNMRPDALKRMAGMLRTKFWHDMPQYEGDSLVAVDRLDDFKEKKSVREKVAAKRSEANKRLVARKKIDERAEMMLDKIQSRLNEIGERATQPDLETKYSTMSTEIHNSLGKAGFAATHDSPIRHEGKFDWRTHNGKGEGNASFGEGTYLSTADGVHRSYKAQFTAITQGGGFTQSISANQDVRDYLYDLAADLRKEGVVDSAIVKEAVLDGLREQMREYNEGSSEKEAYADAYFRARDMVASDFELGSGDVSPTYHVTVNIKQDEMLDWNAPFNEQSDFVKRALRGVKEARPAAVTDIATGKVVESVEVSGETIYKNLARRLGSQAKASDYLQSLGILGHKYAAAGGSNDKHPNYVIYDDSKIETNYVHFSKQNTGDTDIKPINPEQALADIARMLGKDFDAKVVEKLGGKAGTWTPGVIKLATSAADGTQFHEALHELFNQMRTHGAANVAQLIERVANSPLILRKLEQLLSDHPKAIKQLKSPEEAAAYLFQFWNMGLINVGPETKSLFQTIKDLIVDTAKELHSWVNAAKRDERKAEKARKMDEAEVRRLFEALAGGAAATSDVNVRQALYDGLRKNIEAHTKAVEDLGQRVEGFWQGVGRYVVTSESMLNLYSKHPELKTVADKFHQMAGKSMKNQARDSSLTARGGLIEAKHAEVQRRLNLFERFLVDGKYDEKDMALATKHLEANTKSADKKINGLIDFVRRYYGEMYDYMVQSDVRRLDPHSEERWVPIQKRKDYFTQSWSIEELTKDHDGFVSTLLSKHAKELAYMAQQANAEIAAWNKNPKTELTSPTAKALRDKQDAEFQASGKAIAKSQPLPNVTPEMIAEQIYVRLLNSTGMVDIQETNWSLGLTPAAGAVNRRELDWLDKEAFSKYKSKDLVEIVTNYTRTVVSRAEYQKRFGYGGEVIGDAMDTAMLREMGGQELVDRAAASLDGEIRRWKKDARAWHKDNPGVPYAEPYPTLRLVGIQQHRAQVGADASNEALIKAEKTLRPAINAVRAMEGTLGNDISPAMRNFGSWVNTYQNVRLLPLALFTNFSDVIGITVQGGTLGDAWNAFTAGMREVRNTWVNEKGSDINTLRAEEWGVSDAGAMLDTLGQNYSSVYMTEKARNINNKFFRIIGMEGWNRGVRITATAVGERIIGDWVKNGVDAEKPGEMARFERLFGEGADPKKIKLDAQGNLDTQDAANRAAIQRFVQDAVMSSNSAVRATWMSDPRMATFAHLKNFAYAFHSVMLKGILDQTMRGNLRPALVAGLGYASISIAAGAVKEMLIPGDEPYWMKGGLDGYLEYGYNMANLGGVPQMYWDGVTDLDPAKLAGPFWDQIQNTLSSPIPGLSINLSPVDGETELLRDRKVAVELAKALPAGNLAGRAMESLVGD